MGDKNTTQPKYKLKEDEEWEDTALMHFPHYCPNCGNSMSKPQPYWADSSRESTPENPFKGTGYDCYCPYCHWSGEIIPDVDRRIVERRQETLPYSEVFRSKEIKKKI